MIQEELQKLEKLSVQVSKKVEALTAENERLNARLAELEAQVQEKEVALDHFKNKIKISNIVDNRPVSPEDTVEMSDLINSYIQEIDQLITHLSE
ncbi:MAG: ATG16 family protein [Algoriphagus sp.]|jgi:cell division septum initiation protein DivIVA|nr:ATG16 family protein [Algoriphagus sp.]